MKLPSFRIDGQRALVTGASRGIGLAAASALAQSGAQVLITARTEADLEVAAQQIREVAAGASVRCAVLDVTDRQAVDALLQSEATFDILVNNAGTNRPRDIREVTNEDIDDLIDLNLKSMVYLCRAFARQPRTPEAGGSIINISSQMGLVGSPKRTLYCATKHGMEGFTKALAWDLGPEKIRVNTICPTFVETDMTRHMFEDPSFKTFVLSKIALGELAQVQDIMGAVVFLASPASRMTTGSALMVDGGWTAA
jgi:NAD(P)-dependent dehydrogenase (short-subunit alcohol dehydrogenase family)